MGVSDIEKAIAQPPATKPAELRRWFAEFDAEAWDRQIAADAVAGRLEGLVSEARADYAWGGAREF